MVQFQLIRLLNVLQSLVNLVQLKLCPRKVLVKLVVSSVFDQCHLVLSVSHIILVLMLKEKANLDDCVRLALLRERVRADGVLEVLACMLQLIRLRKDHSKLIQHFRLLVELGRHLEHGNQG